MLFRSGNLAVAIADDFRLHFHRTVVLGGNEDAVLLDMHLVGGLQPDMAIDARAGVPARLFLSIDMHYQSVLASYYYIRCQVEGKTGVTIHVVAEAMPIEPNGGTMIYAIKVDGDLLALSHSLLPFRREREILAVDALTAGEITSRTSHLWIEGQFDAPVMGDGDWTEILVARCLRGFRCGEDRKSVV